MYIMKKLFFTFILCIFTLSINVCAKTSTDERFDIPAEKEELTLSEYATIFYGENNTKEAMSYILKIKETERTAQDWLILGNILQDNGKITDAIFMYQKAILTDKTYYKAYYNLANIYFEENKLNLALKNYKLASKYNDEFPFAFYNSGCVYLELGNIKKAKLMFIKAIDIKNTIPEFHYNLAYVYKKLNKEKLSKQYLENYNQLILNK